MELRLPETSNVDVARLQRERDLYRKLLELGTRDDVEAFLDEALGLIVETAGARRGYVELYEEREGADRARVCVARGCSNEEIEEIRAAMSQGVIAEAIATGRTILTVSALSDPRFKDRGSVRRNRIEAVLCAPIGAGAPVGVVYLQDREEPGPFSEEDRGRVETFARYLGTFADRLLMRRRRRDETDPTLPFRRALKANAVIGRSPAIATVLQQASAVAPLDVSVLLTGESGTGKTQIARVIHENGPRAAGPFVEVNCGALPEPLLESELFGAMPGAHSTASRKIDGKVAAAHRGTLFLDEVAELKLGAQASLLQFLHSKEFYPLGSSKPVRADVRVIAATNVDLKAAVARKEFRADLFYRLQVLPLRLPSLAERRDDVRELAAHFCKRACEAHQLPLIHLSLAALSAAENAEWPGNIRELDHAVQAAVIRAAGEGLLQVERRHLFPEARPEDSADGEPRTFQSATRRFQSQLLRRALEETSWNVAEAAARLEIARSHVYNLIRAFGLERTSS